MHNRLLLLRFSLLNLLAAAMAAAAAAQGWLDEMLATDRLHLVKLIVAVFAAGLLAAGYRALVLSRELDALARGAPIGKAAWFLSVHTPHAAELLRAKLQIRLGTIRYCAHLLVFLGLIGTVIGFILALAGIDPGRVRDPAAIGPMVSRLLEGMSIALYTTLAGSILNIWLTLNCRMLERATLQLYGAIVTRGAHD